MKISDGKRIKLPRDLLYDNVQPGSKLGADFSALEEDVGISGNARLFDCSDSDDFPDLHELVRTRVRGEGDAQGGLLSCNSNYSDSDMDAMIRDVRLEEVMPTEIDAARTQDSSTSDHDKSTQLTAPSKRKRSVDPTEDLATTQVTSASAPQSRFRPQVRAQGKRAPLF